VNIYLTHRFCVGGVRLGVWGVVLVVCVCVGARGVVLCRCACVCVRPVDLCTGLHEQALVSLKINKTIGGRVRRTFAVIS